MAKKKSIFKSTSVRGLLASIGIPVGFILFLAILYFYIYLPSLTNHGESITVPDPVSYTHLTLPTNREV